MPYIKKELRGVLDHEINTLAQKLKTRVSDEQLDGSFNYVVTRLADELYGGGGYAVYNRLVGVLTCVIQEFYRRKISVYEDKKCKENGDVYV